MCQFYSTSYGFSKTDLLTLAIFVLIDMVIAFPIFYLFYRYVVYKPIIEDLRYERENIEEYFNDVNKLVELVEKPSKLIELARTSLEFEIK